MMGNGIGLAIIGCGTIGRIRAVLARETIAVEWLGLCDIDAETAKGLAADTNADFVTTDFRELLAQPEVTAVIVATAENEHVDPIIESAALGHPMFIEKPLATDPVDSARVLAAIEENNVDAVVGYTQRFRRRFQAVKQRLRDGQIGDVTSVVTRAFMNRMVPDRHHQQDHRSGQPHTNGRLGHPQPGYVHVADGGQDTGRGLCAISGHVLA